MPAIASGLGELRFVGDSRADDESCFGRWGRGHWGDHLFRICDDFLLSARRVCRGQQKADRE